LEFAQNPFSFTLIASGITVGTLSILIAIILKGATRWVALTMVCAAIWGVFYGLELAYSDLDTILYYVRLEYFGIAFTAGFWVISALKYTNYPVRSWTLVWGLLFLIPVITLVLVWTNEFHHLYYKDLQVVHNENFSTLSITAGPWYYVHLGFSYFAYALGTYILWKRFRYSDQIFKKQTRLIILSGIFPILFNIFYQTGIFKPFGSVDLTPYAFLLTFLILGFAILKYHLFSIKPIAQNKIIEALTRGVLVLNDKGMILDFNPALRGLFQNSKLLKAGNSTADLFHDFEEILNLIHNSDKKVIEVIRHVQGKEQCLRIESIHILERKNVISGTILLFEDITAQRETNAKLIKQTAELQELNNLKDKYFSILSHDLKGPIFGVKELVHLAQTGLISQKEFFEMLPEVSKSMEQVALLLENLLAWTSSQLRGEYIQISDFNINKIIYEQSNILERIAKGKEILIELENNNTSNRVYADKNMIALVFRNLLSNAIKFSETRGRIRIVTHDEDEYVKISIQDYGKGVSKENLTKILQGVPFSTPGHNREAGTGLGLILVKEYIEKNNGKLEISSIEGEGSIFCIYLPVFTGSPNY